ncbi:MAG: GTPase Era [Wolbachia endosymbiont of Menacanthus eurysternus]|nr:MAG: GTPase Era [Wolbachia endosymbiont of Menacanthus eurysternus]
MEEQRCLFVTITGLPNAGKSTLINSIVGEKIAIVTSKMHTTRTKINGIIVRGNTQIVFLDSPGILPSTKTKLEKILVKSAWSAINSGDITLLLIDVSNYLINIEKIKILFTRLRYIRQKCILVINKIDLIGKIELKIAYKHLDIIYKFKKIFAISALRNDGLSDLINYLCRVAPVNSWFFDKDQITDSSKNFLSSEITREKLFFNLREELPYSITVATERIQKDKDGSLIIKQIIFVLRENHKKIVLGKDGNNIKKVGIDARVELGKLFKCKVHLFLFVKVRNWVDYPERYIGNV